MLRGAFRGRASGSFAPFRLARVAMVAAAGGVAVAGCSSSGMPVLEVSARDVAAVDVPTKSVAGAHTVAFESIDGPPEAVFRKLVDRLREEANARKVSIVSREQPAQYRICGYVAARVQGKKTTITWVWDVFTADHVRVARFTGEVPGAPSERAWAAADDAVVARMAQDGMSRLDAFLARSAPGDAAAPNLAAASGAQGPMAFLPASRP